MSASLFDDVVAATGLSPRIAPFVVRRVCSSVGFQALKMEKEHLRAIIPALAAAIRIYKPPEHVDRALRDLDRLLAGTQGTEGV